MISTRRRGAALLAVGVMMFVGCGPVHPTAKQPAARGSVSPTASPLFPPLQGGINLGGYYDYVLSEGPPATRDRTMADVVRSGARWIRVDTPDTTSTEPVIESALSHGLHVDLVLTDDRTADTPSAIGDLATTVARRFSPEGIHTYEVLNEPNGKLSAGSYTAILHQAYTDIHAVDPASNVISGGLERTGGRAEPSQYLSDMYASGVRGSMDSVGVHPYAYPDLPDEPQGGSNVVPATPGDLSPSCGQAGSVECVQAVMKSNGDGTKPIWITEFGVPTGTDNGYPAFSQAFQARSITRIFAAARALSHAGPLFVYEWKDDTGGDFGLSDAQGRPKLALGAFRDAIANPPPA